ncbi:MAG: response regulator transcription factor [Crocinitomicaceae bacterium]|nr:response regulator transcription factor [Crocinitomicaceae bacterium]
MKKPIRIALLDKQTLFRQSLESLLSMKTHQEVIFSLSEIDELLQSLDPGMINLLIIDVSYLNENEWLKLSVLLHRFPEIRTMVVTEAVSTETFNRLLNNRISGYYSKNTDSSILLQAIDAICSINYLTQLQLGPKVRDQLTMRKFETQKRNRINEEIHFSRRELQVLQLICKEFLNEEIATKLKISVRTVETHRSRMIKKTNSKSILGVIMYALSTNKFKEF